MNEEATNTASRIAFDEWAKSLGWAPTPLGSWRAGAAHALAHRAPLANQHGRIEHFKFDLNDKVLVNEIQRPGKVDGLMIDYLGPQYRVVYWDNAERKVSWLNADEISQR